MNTVLMVDLLGSQKHQNRILVEMSTEITCPPTDLSNNGTREIDRLISRNGITQHHNKTGTRDVLNVRKPTTQRLTANIKNRSSAILVDTMDINSVSAQIMCRTLAMRPHSYIFQMHSQCYWKYVMIVTIFSVCAVKWIYVLKTSSQMDILTLV